MFDTILVAVDSSEAADGALDLAAKLAKADAARLVLANVVDLSKLIAVAGYESPYPMDVIRVMQGDSGTILDAAKNKCDPAIQTVSVSSAPVSSLWERTLAPGSRVSFSAAWQKESFAAPKSRFW